MGRKRKEKEKERKGVWEGIERKKSRKGREEELEGKGRKREEKEKERKGGMKSGMGKDGNENEQHSVDLSKSTVSIV